MATILLSAAGAAIGGLSSGTVLGLTGAVVGRAVGATLGRVIDQRLMGQGSEVIEQGKMDRFRLTGAAEGAPVARLFGQMRLGGQVIWATRFKESVAVTGGGKGAPPQPRTASYSYSVSLAVALCEGEIARVGRVWADGAEIAQTDITMRVYRGTDDQMPDPKMEAVEGVGMVPAYRGIAYVVIEDLDLTPYGNRVPQFSFEVIRPASPAGLDSAPQPSKAIRAVAMMPGTGEYALATTVVSYAHGFGKSESANVNTASGEADFLRALDNLQGELPNCGATSLIVSWFGDDLRAGQCSVKPKVEQNVSDGAEMPWSVAGLTRSNAELIARVEDRVVYGGTPADASVIEAIEALNEAGQDVMFYPFLLMEILEGNGLPDPWRETGDQPVLPWRGRITGEKAPGIAGSPDRTAAADAEVAAFFGTASASDFTVSAGSVTYSGPSEWRYRRFILHCAALAAAAGGVESFCIGSEMRSLTQLRGASGFPAVQALIDLAAEVRLLLPDAKLSYAADWSEYFGYHPQDGSGDVFFHLDALWADANIDFVGIDNYMPLSDWRDGEDHADAGWRSIYNLDYLKANIEGGEGYDWYYGSVEGRAAQKRLPITDGTENKPWIYRYKDIRNWWANAHHNRTDGVENDLTDLGQAPSTWYPFLNGVVAPANATPIAGFDAPAEISTMGHIAAAGRINTNPIDNSGGKRFVFRSWVGEGTSGKVRMSVAYTGNGPLLEYDFASKTISVGDNGHAVHSSSATDIGNGIVRLELDATLAADDNTIFLLVGPNSTVSGESVIAYGAVAMEHDAEVSAWIPQSKPLRFTELGCAAIDKGTNQPNKFLDPKSSESSIPYYSTGRRDDLIQMQYLRAMTDYWLDPEKNPVSDVYGGPMLDMDHAYVWAWDARPWPAFPNNQALWSDGVNHARGHWISGRMGAQPLADVVAEICEDAGLEDYDVSELYGFVRGTVSSDVESARARLQPLMLAYGFEASERDGKIVFRSRVGMTETTVDADLMAVDEDGNSAPVNTRQPRADMVGRVRLAHTEAAGAYETRVAEAVFPDDGEDGISQSELPLVMTGAEGRAVAERWLAESRIARDTISFSLPPSRLDVDAGTIFELVDGSSWRVDRVEDAGARRIEAVRSEMEIYEPSDTVDEAVTLEAFVPPVPVSPVFMDLPLLTGGEVEHTPHLAVAAVPWPGVVAAYSAPGDSGYTLNTLIERRATVGVLETALFAAEPGIWDRGPALRVRLSSGALSSAEMADVLNGANAAAIGDGDGANWEVIQFAQATLVGEDLWDISLRLRGQAGSDGIMPADWPVGSLFVLLDGAPDQIEVPLSARGLARHYRVGQAAKSYDHPSYVHRQLAFDGIGLRPYAPAHLRAPNEGTGREISWIRRTRIDGDSWQGTDVPLGEEVERYVLRVRDGGGIMRREATLSAPAFTYSDAMRTSDGVSAPYSIEVAQVSARFGPGPFARIEIND